MRSPDIIFRQVAAAVKKSIKDTYFPNGRLSGKERDLVLENLEVEYKSEDTWDAEKQEKTKDRAGTFSAPIKATLALVDKKTGKVISRKTYRIANLPIMTQRYTFIVGGNEISVPHQSVLRPGIYTRQAISGELEAKLNMTDAEKRQLQAHVSFDPESRRFFFSVGHSNFPLFPTLELLGIPKERIVSTFGEQAYEANKVGPTARKNLLSKLYKRFLKKNPPEDKQQALRELKDKLRTLLFDQNVTRATLGKPFKELDEEVLFESAKELVRINRGEKEVTGYDDMRFKKARYLDDYLADRIFEHRFRIMPKLKQNLDRLDEIERILPPKIFDDIVKGFFTGSSLAELNKQNNPLAILDGARKHTITGEHGISATAIRGSSELKEIHPSSFGLLDPLHTPESDRTGITLRLATLADKMDNNQLGLPSVLHWKTKKPVLATAPTLASGNVAFYDQLDMKALKQGKFKFKDPKNVRVIDSTGDVRAVPESEVDFVIVDQEQLFSPTTSLIPFLGSDNGNRVAMAGSQLHQAISLKHREAPLVQAETRTAEKLVADTVIVRSVAPGVVKSVTDREIKVKEDSGKIRTYKLYKNFPLNEKKSYLHSEPLVKPGDRVSVGQPLADSNFTKDGKLAIGTNLIVGYMPFKDYNFEDGVVISESAAKKLTSLHLYRKSMDLSSNIMLGKKKFQTHAPTYYTKEQLEKIGDDGVIKVGQKVKKGDPLILAVRKNSVISEEEGVAKASRGKILQWSPKPVEWKEDYEGEVVKVVRRGDRELIVHVRTEEPMQVGDKITGRHGNKGIITKVLPDEEMPHIKDPITGKMRPVEVIYSPLAVPGRINVGQIHETVLGWVAQKTGRPITVKNFDPAVEDYREALAKIAKKHGIPTDGIEAIDPKTGKSYGKIQVGPKHVVKLEQQVDKKMSARSAGYGNPYDNNKAPTTGGGRLGHLGIYGLLAHGALHNLREMQTYKSSFDEEFWRAINRGEMIPPPRVPFAYEKFEAYLRGMGVNVKKDGNHLVLEPLTDKQVLQMSSGEVRDPGRMLLAKNLKPEKGGLFDPKIFGYDGGGYKGNKWGHIKLDTEMPNPLFEAAIASLLEIKQEDITKILKGEKTLDGKTGPQAIASALDKIDVKKAKAEVEAKLKDAEGSELNKLNRKIRYLAALERIGITPRQAYMRKYIPVIPPVMRPVSEMADGSLNVDDLNGLYRGLGLINKQIQEMDPDLKKIPEEAGKLYAGLYDAMKALTGIGSVNRFNRVLGEEPMKGFMHTIVGRTAEGRSKGPKEGFFQKRVFSRKQDISMRSVIVPDPSVGLDEIALPTTGLFKVMEPHVIRRLRSMGFTTLQAKKLIKEKHPLAKQALESVSKDIPVIVKRDPVLHKFGVLAFKAVPKEGKTIGIHPLVTTGYNADFDGDHQNGYVIAALREPTPHSFPLAIELPPEVASLGLSPYAVPLFEFPHTASMGKNSKGTITAYAIDDRVRVLSFHEEKGFCWKRPISWSVHRKRPLVIVTLSSGRQILTDDEERSIFGKRGGEWRRLKPSLAMGVEVPSLETPPPTAETFQDVEVSLREGPPKLVPLDFGMGFLVGLFLSGGWYRNPPFKAEVMLRKRPLLRTVAGLLAAYFPECRIGFVQIREGLWKAEISGRLFSEVLQELGFSSKERALPGKLFSAPLPFKQGLLSALLEGSVLSYELPSNELPFPEGTAIAAEVETIHQALSWQALAESIGLRLAITTKAPRNGTGLFRKRWGLVLLSEPKGLELPTRRKEHTFTGVPSPEQEKVAAVEETGRYVEGWDLTVPGADTFVSAQGVVLSNTMAVFVPVTKEAIDEAWRLVPSNNIFNPGSGELMHLPGKEAVIGIFLASSPKKGGKVKGKYSSAEAVAQDLASGKLDYNDRVIYKGKETTPGRIALAAPVPEPLKPQILYGKEPINKKFMKRFLTELAKKYPKSYGEVAHKWKDVGFDAATRGSLSITIDDMAVDKKLREKHFGPAVKAIEKLRQSKLPLAEQKKRAAQILFRAMNTYEKALRDDINKRKNNLWVMLESGGLSKWTQIKQLAGAPGMYIDSKGRPVPIPVVRNYAEGMPLVEYLTAAHGARLGMLSRATQTSEPGAVTKEVVASNLDSIVVEEDCGTTDGVWMPTSGEPDVYDRYLAKPAGRYPRNTLLTPQIVADLKRAGISKILVRSPLKCKARDGLCKKCVGLLEPGKEPDKGTNVGVLAAQSMGEPMTQMAMDSFHTGGVATTKKKVGGFSLAKGVLHLDKRLPNEAVLAQHSGTVRRIERDPLGGFRIHLDTGKELYTPELKEGIKPGMKVERGQPISPGFVNPAKYFDITNNIHKAQEHIVNQLHTAYGGRVRKRHMEIVARKMAGIARVEDPGSMPGVFRGDYRPIAELEHFNKNLKPGQRPVKYRPQLLSTKVLPLYMQEDWLARLNYQRLKDTIIEGALQGWRSDIHGKNPVPGLVWGAEFGKPPQGARTPY